MNGKTSGGYVEVTPAYGRDYTSKAQVLVDWEAGKDFILQDFGSRWDGKPINKEDAVAAGYTAVNIRYKRNTQIAVVRLASDGMDPLVKLAALSGVTAGCEKLPEGGMRDNCEKKKEEGAKNKEASSDSDALTKLAFLSRTITSDEN